ncbi:MAG: response regulator transcription factor [Clostridia bacterium]|nr:response regulator transcription factor [Clostridia bacterium]MBQ4350919.1 response regulator transcription factor [Clostridia bacterium]
MNIAIVDDVEVILEGLRHILTDYAAANRMEFDFSLFSNAEDLLRDYTPYQYTIIFLDILMDGMDGVEAAKKIREVDRDTIIIFLTSSVDHMPHAFLVHAYDYITKPMDAGRLFQVLDDILKRKTDPDADRLTFVSNRQQVSLPYKDIVTIRAESNYLEILDRRRNVWRTRMTFSSMQETLSEDGRFLLILRGILVNMDFVTGFSEDTCHMKGDMHLPINIRNAKKIEQKWKNYNFQKVRNKPRT